MSQRIHPIFNIPNILTIARILLIPVFIILVYWPPAVGVSSTAISTETFFAIFDYQFSDDLIRHLLLTSIFLLAAITDWFDGFLARKLNQSSAFGRFLDPVADKLMVATSLIILVQWHANIVMAFAAIVIICREIAVSALREWMAELGANASVAVSYIGKLKTFMQMAAITVFLLNFSFLYWIAYLLMTGAVILTLWSMIIYLKAAWPYLKQP